MARARKQEDVIAEREARKKVARATRGQAVHNAENAGAMAIPLGLLAVFGAGDMDPVQVGYFTAAIAWIGSALGKFMSENDIPKRILTRLFPTLLALILLTGCSTIIGVSTPVSVGEGESAVIAHKVSGVCWTFWDGSCGANIEAGTGGQDALDSVGGWLEAVARAAGGLLSGAGAAITPEP